MPVLKDADHVRGRDRSSSL